MDYLIGISIYHYHSALYISFVPSSVGNETSAPVVSAADNHLGRDGMMSAYCVCGSSRSVCRIKETSRLLRILRVGPFPPLLSTPMTVSNNPSTAATRVHVVKGERSDDMQERDKEAKNNSKSKGKGKGKGKAK